jgi:hypothetical protein
MEVYIMTIQNTKRSIALVMLLGVGMSATFAGSNAQFQQENKNQAKKVLTTVKNFIIKNKKNIAYAFAGTALVTYAGYVSYNHYKDLGQDTFTQAIIDFANSFFKKPSSKEFTLDLDEKKENQNLEFNGDHNLGKSDNGNESELPNENDITQPDNDSTPASDIHEDRPDMENKNLEFDQDQNLGKSDNDNVNESALPDENDITQADNYSTPAFDTHEDPTEEKTIFCNAAPDTNEKSDIETKQFANFSPRTQTVIRQLFQNFQTRSNRINNESTIITSQGIDNITIDRGNIYINGRIVDRSTEGIYVNGKKVDNSNNGIETCNNRYNLTVTEFPGENSNLKIKQDIAGSNNEIILTTKPSANIDEEALNNGFLDIDITNIGRNNKLLAGENITGNIDQDAIGSYNTLQIGSDSHFSSCDQDVTGSHNSLQIGSNTHVSSCNQEATGSHNALQIDSDSHFSSCDQDVTGSHNNLKIGTGNFISSKNQLLNQNSKSSCNSDYIKLSVNGSHITQKVTGSNHQVTAHIAHDQITQKIRGNLPGGIQEICHEAIRNGINDTKEIVTITDNKSAESCSRTRNGRWTCTPEIFGDDLPTATTLVNLIYEKTNIGSCQRKEKGGAWNFSENDAFNRN